MGNIIPEYNLDHDDMAFLREYREKLAEYSRKKVMWMTALWRMGLIILTSAAISHAVTGLLSKPFSSIALLVFILLDLAVFACTPAVRRLRRKHFAKILLSSPDVLMEFLKELKESKTAEEETAIIKMWYDKLFKERHWKCSEMPKWW